MLFEYATYITGSHLILGDRGVEKHATREGDGTFLAAMRVVAATMMDAANLPLTFVTNTTKIANVVNLLTTAFRGAKNIAAVEQIGTCKAANQTWSMECLAS